MTLQPRFHVARQMLLRSAILLALTACFFPSSVQASIHASVSAATPTSTVSAAPGTSGVPPGHSDRILRLKFKEDVATTADLHALLPDEAWQIIQKMSPLFTLPKDVLKALKVKGNERLKQEKGDAAPILPDLGQWYEVLLVEGTNPDAAIALLSAVATVETVGSAPLITDPPQTPVTPDFSGLQGYLDPAPGGIDARYAWTIDGGNGAGITIYDVEYGWLQDHEDLSQARDVQLLLDPGDANQAVSTANENHGTSVLGEMIAGNDGKGVTGIAWAAHIKLAPTNTVNLGWNIANAILLAAADAQPGDVILVEQQLAVCNLGTLGPAEDELDVFQAVQTASALGLVVVEAAGNGGTNLDSVDCNNHFNRNSRDSGAILVGAGKPPASGADRQRETFSSYGSRVDVQAWGSSVFTTGTGYYYGPAQGLPKQYYYTDRFSGTSSASPMVAGAAAIVQALAKQRNGAPLLPWQVRQLLADTGSSQQGNTAEHIGPRPNLRQAIAQLPQSATTIWVNVGGSQDDGLCAVGDCSLSEAIRAANADAATNIIELIKGATYTLTGVNNTDPTYGANGLPPITSPIIINAEGATIERGAGAPGFRLFQVSSGGSLTLRQATLRNGQLAGQPGAALLNLGTASIEASTFTGNTAADGVAANGGAIANRGTLSVVSSTLWNNTATGNGGAIHDTGTLLVINSTLAGNSATAGGNVWTSTAATLKNTLLVKGASGANCSGSLDTSSIKNGADDGSCGSSAAAWTTAQIGLQPLAGNGGPTQTMALSSNSSAIDAGHSTTCRASKVNGRDQRGYARFWDGNNDGVAACDMGAYEYGSTATVQAPAADTVPPLVLIGQTPAAADGKNGWYRGLVNLSLTLVDDSDIIDVRCALDSPTPPATFDDLPPEICPYLGGVTVSTDGAHTLYAAAMDIEGNASEPAATAFKIDATPPVITCPAPGPFLLASGAHAVGPAGVDASVSGLDETASSLSGSVPTESIGRKAITFSAVDLAGNSAGETCGYDVIYDFGGFYPPIQPGPALNAVQAGAVAPVKFSLDGDQGFGVLAEGYPKSQEVDCKNLAPLKTATATLPAGKSGLSYDPATGWYTYAWKTDKQRSVCRGLVVRLADGTQHLAYFQFR